MARNVIAFLTFILSTRLAGSANILAIFVYSFSTSYLVVLPYIKALINNGHNITCISTVGNLPDIEGVRHIRIIALDHLVDGEENIILFFLVIFIKCWSSFLSVTLCNNLNTLIDTRDVY